jgi:hypothetical protein
MSFDEKQVSNGSCLELYSRAATIISVFVAALVGFVTLRYNSENLELGNRAWLIPVSASFVEPPAPLSRIEIKLKNSGKDPAISIFQVDRTPSPIKIDKPLGRPYVSSEVALWPRDAVCPPSINGGRTLGLYPPKAEPVAPIYPSQETEYVRHIPPDVFNAISDGEHSIMIRGCFVYRDSYGKRRRSPYCFYAVPNEPGQSGFRSQLRLCPIGAEDPN